MTNDQSTKAPGWYRDPEDPAFIRYWDGAHWTDQRRDRPAWAPAMTAEEEAAHRAALRRRKWWMRGAGSLLMVALLVATLFAIRSDVPSIPARTVEDTAFTDAAQQVCARRMPAILKQPPEPGGEDKPNADEQLAQRVERTATDLSGVMTELRAIPVAEPDRVEVEGWFRDWATFIDVGHRYAGALRRGKPAEFRKVGDEGTAPSRRIYVFAKANGMPDCVFSAT
ncbi:MAG TPA: DUF2510 domain-containing protein [Acidimicrobiales bacterium]|nr:DUF2510 domain-containing protein [Acidimicrobiales bacterium]